MQTDPMGIENKTQLISEEAFDASFKPRGAMVFFVLLLILGVAIWYGIYFLMLKRA